MFEFHAYDRRAHAQPPLTPRLKGAPLAHVDIAAISFLFWSEHCVECAAPACHNSCMLYQPRTDGRCRRFAFGLFRNTRFAGPRGYGAEVAFRRWGKLKANGNTWMEPLADVVRRERWLGRTVTLRRVLGRVARTVGRTTAWADPAWADPTRELDRRARRLHRRVGRQTDGTDDGATMRPDAFLIEVCNLDDTLVCMELEMRVAADLIDDEAASAAPPPFRCVVHLGPGHGRHVIPHAAFCAVSDCGLPFKLALTPLGEATPRLVLLALDFVTWRTPEAVAPRHPVEPPARKCPAVKCIVFDLDDTVWQGTLSEGGALDLVSEVRRVLNALDRRGILLAIASRNDAGVALARLRDFGLADMFVATRIDWRTKSGAIAEIAADLDLGLDAFAFVDDSAFERAEVAAALPDVACFDARDLAGLVDHPRLRGGTSETARDRRRLYHEAAQRDARRVEFVGDEEAFLRSCRLRLEIAPCRPDDFTRVAELAQRTNQLNASGTRYGADGCAALIDDPEVATFVLRCADVHGNYGVVGFAAVRLTGQAIRIEEFMLSCRVQGRRLEQAFFHHLASESQDPAGGSLWINFRATGRNGPAARVLDNLGFHPCADGGRVLNLPTPHLACDLVAVVAMANDAGAADGKPAGRAIGAAARRAMA